MHTVTDVLYCDGSKTTLLMSKQAEIMYFNIMHLTMFINAIIHLIYQVIQTRLNIRLVILKIVLLAYLLTHRDYSCKDRRSQ